MLVSLYQYDVFLCLVLCSCVVSVWKEIKKVLKLDKKVKNTCGNRPRWHPSPQCSHIVHALRSVFLLFYSSHIPSHLRLDLCLSTRPMHSWYAHQVGKNWVVQPSPILFSHPLPHKSCSPTTDHRWDTQGDNHRATYRDWKPPPKEEHGYTSSVLQSRTEN